MKTIEYILLFLLFYTIITVIWQTVELVMIGSIRPNDTDTIIAAVAATILSLVHVWRLLD